MFAPLARGPDSGPHGGVEAGRAVADEAKLAQVGSYDDASIQEPSE